MSEPTANLRWVKALGVVCVALFARAVLDKWLALQAGPTVVALWAQYQSLVELIASITLVGLGQGLTVYAARESHDFGQLLRAGMIWGLFISGLLAAVVLVLMQYITNDSTMAAIRRDWVVLGVAAGLASIVPGLFMAWWQGREQRGRMVLVLAASWLPILLMGSGWLGEPDIGRLLSVQLAMQLALLVLLLVLHWQPLRQGASWRTSPLLGYLGAGLSIGLLSPLSMLWVRAELAEHLSWEQVAQLQALWRLTEWVTGISASVLFLLHLPGLARVREGAGFDSAYRRLWCIVFRPAAAVLALILACRVPLLLFLYDERFIMPWSAAGLFVLGDILRVAAWLPLLGLFAQGRVAAIAWGECLSLPLFACAVTVVRPDTLDYTGVLYALAYLLYFVFNTHFLRQGLQRRGLPA